ncbi:tRNA pseudouridine(55) synthase TruB [Wolbachia endosymbiont of Pentidionis agamae]|uniref:tRNA pseudouridine(55) synthase TruB n=1 Tax=Wolbachia endosymbiont of Pentidionis agamae TaxID=3110435 RepID=UPI002FCF3009
MHGWLNLDKPIGLTSAQAVNQIKKFFKAKKAGHLGTLDPLATGVLPIALGEATKTIPYVYSGLKAYNFTIKWGEQKTTDDLSGEVVKRSSVQPSLNQIKLLIKNFVGTIEQTPPNFSAIKIHGVRAHKLARNGEEVCLKPRFVSVYQLILISHDVVNNSSDFFISCGSGVYVRSIARDLGISLGCFGHIIKLRRVMVGDFKESQSIIMPRSIDSNSIISIHSVLKSIVKVNISFQDAKKIKNGQELILNCLSNLKNNDICYTVVDDLPIAICCFANGIIKPIRVFCI